VFAVFAPLGFTVADEDDLGAGGAHVTEGKRKIEE
jgi:hypothetical protein